MSLDVERSCRLAHKTLHTQARRKLLATGQIDSSFLQELIAEYQAQHADITIEPDFPWLGALHMQDYTTALALAPATLELWQARLSSLEDPDARAAAEICVSTVQKLSSSLLSN